MVNLYVLWVQFVWFVFDMLAATAVRARQVRRWVVTLLMMAGDPLRLADRPIVCRGGIRAVVVSGDTDRMRVFAANFWRVYDTPTVRDFVYAAGAWGINAVGVHVVVLSSTPCMFRLCIDVVNDATVCVRIQRHAPSTPCPIPARVPYRSMDLTEVVAAAIKATADVLAK